MFLMSLCRQPEKEGSPVLGHPETIEKPFKFSLTAELTEGIAMLPAAVGIRRVEHSEDFVAGRIVVVEFRPLGNIRETVLPCKLVAHVVGWKQFVPAGCPRC